MSAFLVQLGPELSGSLWCRPADSYDLGGAERQLPPSLERAAYRLGRFGASQASTPTARLRPATTSDHRTATMTHTPTRATIASTVAARARPRVGTVLIRSSFALVESFRDDALRANGGRRRDKTHSTTCWPILACYPVEVFGRFNTSGCVNREHNGQRRKMDVLKRPD